MELKPFYFQGGEREPNLCLGAELASYDEVKVGNLFISPPLGSILNRTDQCSDQFSDQCKCYQKIPTQKW